VKAIAIIAVVATIGLPGGVALGRYGTLQPCDMLVMETERSWVRPRSWVRSHGSSTAPGMSALGARIAHTHRSPGECLVALGRILTQDPVDVTLECMRTEFGADLSKVPKPRLAAANSKCSSLNWFLWREDSPL
jgi:hypothetical protein